MLMNPGQRQRLAVLAVVAALASSCNFPLRAVERSLPSPQAAPHSQIFPVAERSGNITVTATCSEGTSGPQWASFGMPFPRGVLSDPTQVLVKSVTGEELPADAIELARWRHFTDAAIDHRTHVGRHRRQSKAPAAKLDAGVTLASALDDTPPWQQQDIFVVEYFHFCSPRYA